MKSGISNADCTLRTHNSGNNSTGFKEEVLGVRLMKYDPCKFPK
jgi:hypothetical protein